MVAERENSALSKQLFAEAITRYQLEPGSITVHNDRGAPTTSGAFIDLLAQLGVERSVPTSDRKALLESALRSWFDKSRSFREPANLPARLDCLHPSTRHEAHRSCPAVRIPCTVRPRR